MSHYDYEAVLEVVDATTVADEVWITEGIEDWQFYFGDVENAFAANADSIEWTTIDIPHDASIEAGCCAS